MKRVEVKLSLPVVAPLLDVIKAAADKMRGESPGIDLPEHDPEFHEAWSAELQAGRTEEVQVLLSLFDRDFFATGVIAFDANNAETIIRACAAVRLCLRTHFLDSLGDDTLEGGNVELETLSEPLRRAFMTYLFLATIQELIIQHLDASIMGEGGGK